VTVPCSDGARARGDQLLATASRVDRWLLVEQPGPWGPPALPTARMPPALARHLTAAAAAAGARLLLLRRPYRTGPDRTVYVVDSVPGRERLLHRRLTDDALLTEPLPFDGDGAGWQEADGPLLLVCTHGKHDRCCAVRGRPVFDVLAFHFPERTWECSHIGGDRFAPNVLVLPDGLYLGRVDPSVAVPVVAALMSGVVPVAHLRGRSSRPQPVQAAELFARAELGRDDADDLRPAGHRAEGPDRWRVRLTGAAGRADVEVLVRRDRAEQTAVLTCQSTDGKLAPVFVCEALELL
jgi:(2Fe-2S) ferredoxin